LEGRLVNQPYDRKPLKTSLTVSACPDHPVRLPGTSRIIRASLAPVIRPDIRKPLPDRRAEGRIKRVPAPASQFHSDLQGLSGHFHQPGSIRLQQVEHTTRRVEAETADVDADPHC